LVPRIPFFLLTIWEARSIISSLIMALLFIRKSDIPTYLHKSDFYLALNDDDEDEEVQIPQNCFKPDTDVNNADDLTLLLSTLRFWGVSAIPRSIVTYTVWHKPVEVIDAFVEFEQELRYVKFLRALCDDVDQCLVTGWEAVWNGYLRRLSGKTGMARVAELCVFHYEYRSGVVWDETTCCLAATAGELDVLRFLHEHGCPWDEYSCLKAAQGGSLECLKYAHEHGCLWSCNTSATAAGHGKLECLEYAHKNGCPWEAVICTNAVTNGSLACLRYAHENGCPWGPEAYMDAWAGSACYRYLRDNGCPEGEASCIAAAKTGDLARLKALHESGCTINERVCEAAVESDHLRVVKYLIEHDLPRSALICDTAVRASSLSCLKYLKEQGCECNNWTLSLAASSRQSMACFTYLVDEGCGVTIACEAAKRHCNAEALLYALQKGCTGKGLLANYAAACGSLACLQYVHEQGGAWDETTCAAVVSHAPGGGQTPVPSWKRLQCLKYSRENGCPWDAATCKAAAGARDLNSLRYAHEHGCPWDEGTCRIAAESGDLACLQYAHEHGCPWNMEAVESATCEWVGSLSCLQYLHEHGCEWPEPVWFAGVDKDVRNRKCLEYAAEHPDQRPRAEVSPPGHCSGCVQRISLAPSAAAEPTQEEDHRAPVPTEEDHRAPVPTEEDHRAPVPTEEDHRASVPTEGAGQDRRKRRLVVDESAQHSGPSKLDSAGAEEGGARTHMVLRGR
jgi:hypothetical protein